MTTEEIKNLANTVFEDPTFKLIYKKDISNILFRAHYTSDIDTKKLNELSKKTNFSTDETNYILSAEFGFKDINDYNDYIDLYKCLVEKYGIGNLDNNDQIQFFSDLRNKEIEYTGKLAELSNDPSKLDSLTISLSKGRDPNRIRPECWKCVFDYQACMQPQVGTTVGIQTDYIDHSSVTIKNQGYTIVWSVSSYYRTTNSIIVYTSTSVSSGCTTIFQSCIAQCNY